MRNHMAALAGTVGLATMAVAEPWSGRSVPDEKTMLAYYVCDLAASRARLSAGQVADCETLYTEVKLGFLPGVDPVGYRRMALPERAEASRRGYAALVAWRSDNPRAHGELRSKARVLLLGDMY